MKIQLPKNVQQIGESPSDVRIYLEDYVITFLQQMKKYDGQRETAVTLYGRREQDEECICFLVYGAVIKENTAEPEKAQSIFPAYEIIGEALLCAEGVKPQQQLRFHEGSHVGGVTLLLLVGEEEDNLAALISAQGARRLSGYYIFYDKNEVMQSILLDWYSTRNRQEPELGGDGAVREFRERYENRQGELQQRKVMNALYAVSLLLVMLCCITGISMMNQYDKMLRMEQTMEHLAVAMREKELPEREQAGAFTPETQIWRQPAGDTQTTAQPAGNVGTGELPAGDTQTTANAGTGEQPAGDTQPAGNAGTDEQPAGDTQPAGNTGTGEQPAGDTQPAGNAETDEQPAGDTQTTAQPAGSGRTVQQPAAEQGAVYIVKVGDTLAAISQSYYGTWKNVPAICEQNQIEDPNNICVGQKLLLP